jgi:hypothetical protein
MIDARAVRQTQDFFVPIGHAPVVDRQACAQLLCPFEFLVAARSCDDTRAVNLGELQGEDRDAARAER